MTTYRLQLGEHIAHLDPVTGDGLLVLPHEAHEIRLHDDPLNNNGSLQWADRMAALNELARHGWVPAEDEDGGLLREGWTEDGREVLGLYCVEPVIDIPDVAQHAAAWPDLKRSAGL